MPVSFHDAIAAGNHEPLLQLAPSMSHLRVMTSQLERSAYRVPRGGSAKGIALALILTTPLPSCSPHPSATASTRALAELTATTRDSAGIRILTLSHSPHEVAQGLVRTTELDPDLRVGYGRPGWSGLAADIASLGGGRFAILDRSGGRIVAFDSLGEEIALATALSPAPVAPSRRQARRRRAIYSGGASADAVATRPLAPIEAPTLRAPLALAAAGDHLVVWQALRDPAFTVIGPGGVVLAATEATLAGDWALARDPDLGTFGPGLRLGPEDLTRRLISLGPAGFVHLLQPNEREYDDESSSFIASPPPAHLIRYGLDGMVRDTLATLAGTPTQRYTARRWDRREQREVSVTRWRQPLFAGRPVWAAGDGWLALGHGDSTQLVVRDLAGDTTLIIRWPEDRLAVSDADRREAALGVIVQRLLNSGNVQKFLESESRPTLRAVIERELEHHLAFAELAPTVTAAYGSGHCLFMAGYDPADWPDGTSLTWLALDLRDGRIAGAFRLSPTPLTLRGSRLELRRQSAAVRDFDPGFAFTTSRGRDGTTVVERFRLPELGC